MKNSTISKISIQFILIGIILFANFSAEAETVIDAPTANKATSVGHTSFQANWTAVKGVVGYALYVYTGSAPRITYLTDYNPKGVLGANTVSATVSGLEMGKTYHYVLKATDGKKESDLSNVISVTTLNTVPAAPVANAATAITTSSFTANWEVAQGASGYVLTVGIRRDAANGGGMVSIDGYNKKPLSGLGTSFVIPEGELESGTEYTYIVYAVNAAGTSSASNWIDVLTVPAPPVVTAATSITNTSFTANWEASTGASSYKLYVLGELDGQPGTYSHITGYNAKEVTGTSLVIPENTLEPGVKHYYHLNAINSSGASSSSGSIYVTTTEPMTYVPDDNFEQALIDLGYDTAPLDDYVPTANINTLTSLDVSNKGIADLSGIADFTALVNLWCYKNQLTALDISLNTKLKRLWFSDNQLIFIDVSANKALTELICNKNLLPSLDVSANTMLVELNCGDNKLAALDVSANVVLTDLSCYNNGLSSLDVRANVDLKELNCERNELTALDVSANVNLETLYCGWNLLASLDVSTNAALTKLSCHNNNLTELNLKNNNNGIINNMIAQSNPDLTCIQVDNSALAATYPDWLKDAAASYAEYCGIPAIPVVLAATDIKSTSFTANWEAVEGATSYKLSVLTYPAKDYVAGYNKKIIEGLGTSFVIPENTLEAGKQYTYTMCAVNDAGESDWSGNISVTTVSQYTLTLSASPVAGGSVNGGGTYDDGTSVTAHATASAGYKFVKWTNGGSSVSTSSSYTFELNANTTLVANFEEIPATQYTLSLSAAPVEGGTVNGEGTVNAGTSVTAKATANADYSFINWTEGETEVSTDLAYTFPLNSDRTLVANFRLTTGISDKTTAAIEICPNPASNYFSIAEMPQGASLKLINAQGTVVFQKENCNRKETVNTDFLTNGMYFILVESENKIFTHKIIIR